LKADLQSRLRPMVKTAFRRRGRIVVVMLAVLIAVSVAPVATMSWKLIQKNREVLIREKQEAQLLEAGSVASQLELHIEGLSAELGRMAQTLGVAVRRHGPIPIEAIERMLGDVTDARIAYIRYSYFKGEEVRSVSAGSYPQALDPLFPATLQNAVRNHVRQTNAETLYSDPLYVGGSDAPLLAIAAPVRASGTFRGVLTALVDLDRVWSVATRRSTGHLLFAVDEAGRVLASSDPQQLEIGTDATHSPIVGRFLQSGKRGTESVQFELEPPDGEGKPQATIGTYQRTDQGWGVFVQAPHEQALWVVSDMIRTTKIWTLLLLLTAVAAAVVLASKLSDPINRLAAASRALASGDFTARVHVSSKNEIGELAHTFNSMAADIERAFEENEELFLDTIRALAEAIDAKDPYTRGHSLRVNRYTMIIAGEMEASKGELRDLYVSSLLHDVGKIGIDDAILKKNGRLTDEEYEVIKTHAALGAQIMSPIRQMKRMIPGLRHHHERWNGNGYPDGLAGEAIPMMARIIAVADTFDAITTVRPYQQPMTFEQAVARVNELREPAFDDRVVDAFNRAVEKGLMQLEEDEALVVPPPPLPLGLDLEPLPEGEEAVAGDV
jgi:HD-GYP domain-containing protein (c-di-GMP phosphodiesterase class II)